MKLYVKGFLTLMLVDIVLYQLSRTYLSLITFFESTVHFISSLIALAYELTDNTMVVATNVACHS